MKCLNQIKKTKIDYIFSTKPYKEDWLFRHGHYKHQKILAKFDIKINGV